MKGFKFGYESCYTNYKEGHTHEKAGKKAIEVMRKVIPSYENQIIAQHKCNYSLKKDNKSAYVEKRDGVCYFAGLCGRGFKFMPIYGKIIAGILRKGDGKYKFEMWVFYKLNVIK